MVDSVEISPAVAQLPLAGTVYFNSTNQPTESAIDGKGKNLVDTIDRESTKVKVAKKSRNAGERIQRR